MAQALDDVLQSTIDEETFDLEDNQETLPEPTKQDTEDDLPEKYRGKSAKEIAMMHQEAEKLIGKQGSEVGDLRRVVDDFIKAQTSKDLKTQEADLDDADFFSDPKSTVSKAIDNHPAVKEAKEAAKAMKRSDTLSRLGAKHPDFMTTIQNSDFIDWIKDSRVRTELYIRANDNLEFEAADELFSTWKEKQEVSKKAIATSKLDRDQQLKAADVGSSGSTETVSKKKYRRSDIIELMKTNPKKYNALANEIMQAYEEGRVI